MKLPLLLLLLAACQTYNDISSDRSRSDARAQAAAPATTVMVYLKESANLAAAARFAHKAERGAAVYHTLVAHAERTQAEVLAALAAAGHTDYRVYHIVNAVLVRNASSALIAQLGALKSVREIVEDKRVRLLLPQNETRQDGSRGKIEESLVVSGADKVWDLGATGQDVVVAGQDSGVDWMHPALKAHYRGWDGVSEDHRYSWHDAIHGSGRNDCGYDTAAPCDDHGHGTHTMGTMVGDDGADNRIGMAPGARWIACRNMDAGEGRPSTYIECFEWFLAPYPQGGDPRTDGDPAQAPDVINNSWGCPEFEGCSGREIMPAIAAVKAAGIVVVASAGNDGPSCGTITDQPATSPDALSVGAYDHRSGRIASFSSRGPSTLDGAPGPHLAAPGVSIRSSTPGGAYQAFMWSGTSMAGPHVAGAVALLISAKPELRGNPDAIMDALKASARAAAGERCGDVAGDAVPNNTFGYGTLDALAAVSLVTH